MSLFKKLTSETFYLVLFSTLSFLFFGFVYDQHIYRLEQLQLFQLTFRYFFDYLSIHGGFIIWFGEFFTQFFHLPFTGAFIITALLIMLQKGTEKMLFKIADNNNLVILTFLPAIGYWILLLNEFYCLSGIFGLIISVFSASVYLKIRNKNLRIIAGILFIPVIYWLTGGAYLVFAACIIVAEISFRRKKRESEMPWWALVFYMGLTVIIPLAARKFLLLDTLMQSYFSEAYFQIRIFFPLPLIIIFSSFPFLILIQHFLSEKLEGRVLTIINVLSPVFLVCLLALGILHYADFNYEKKIKYENLVYNGKWNKIIEIAEKEQPSDQTSMVAVNLALAKTGQLSSKMFHFDQHENSLFLEYERKGMTPFIAGEPFYYMGLINFAQMFAMETVESTPDAKYPSRAFRRVAETFIINGQYDIALKYLTPLSHTLFYKKWAKERIALLCNKENIKSHSEYVELIHSIPKYDFYFNARQMDLIIKFLMDANPENRTAYEYLMAYYLLKKDFNGFLQNIQLAYRMNYSEMPIVFQEAAIFINSITPETPEQILNFPIKSIVLTGFNSYVEMYRTGGKDLQVNINKEFGNTYWYYIHFK